MFSALLIFLLAFVSEGAEFKWLEPANTQVIVIKNPQVDFAARIAAIDRAEHSIHSITYAQGSDPEVGLRLLKAFRRAQHRGLEGHYLVGRLSSILVDPQNLTRAMLADSELKHPGEVISFGGFKNLLAGLRITDMVHEKILIIDAGTPNEMIWIGGRNNAAHSARDLDLGIVLRRIDPSKPYLGDQIKEAFGHTWNAVLKLQKPYPPQRNGSSLAARLNELEQGDKPTFVTPELQGEFERINALLARPVDPTAPEEPFEARPAKMRVLNNEFFNYALTGVFGRSARSRKLLSSDIVDAAAPIVARSKVIYVSAMSVFMPDNLREAVKEALRGGAEVHLITNSRETHRTQLAFGVAYDFSMKDIVELMQVNGKLSVYVLDEKLLKQHADLHHLVNYLHRKLIVADNHVFTGSDNFNDASREHNSEMIVHADDAPFAAKMVELMKSDLQVFSRLSCEQALTDLKRYNIIKRGLNRIYFPFY